MKLLTQNKFTTFQLYLFFLNLRSSPNEPATIPKKIGSLWTMSMPIVAGNTWVKRCTDSKDNIAKILMLIAQVFILPVLVYL